MPTYQYSCTECGEALEVQQSFSDDPLTVCPACQGRLRKVYNAVGVVFKGSGFYRTDSRAGNGSSSKDSGSKDSGSKDSGSGGSSSGSSSPAPSTGASTSSSSPAKSGTSAAS